MNAITTRRFFIPYSAIRIPQSCDPGKLAAWLSAKHVEKAPKKKETPTP